MANLPVSRFWDKYMKKTRRYKIRPEVAQWYVRRAEQYIKSHAGSRLSDHEAHHIEKYLDVKGRNPHLEDWQFEQLVMALKILFIELVGASWANEFCWDHWSISAKSLSNSHVTVARDYQAVSGAQDTMPVVALDNEESELPCTASLLCHASVAGGL